jgi:hypothetical protein
MSRRKKIAIWVMGILGILLVLLLIFLLLLPIVINLEPINEKIVANLSQKIGGELAFQRVDLSFFPRPRAVIHQGSVFIPGKVAGTMESLTVYPEIVPLLRGRVRIGMFHVQAPDLKMELPEKPEGKKEEPTAFSFATIEESVGPVLGLMALKAPGLIVVVEKGRLTVSEENKPVFWFGDIHGRISLPPDKLEIDLACDSNLWESMSLEGWLDPESFKGNGRIDVTHFQLQRLADYLFPLAPQRVADSHVNLSISFSTDGFKALQAEVRGSLPSLTLQRAHEKVVIRGKTLKGTLHMEEDRITISLVELDLDHPRLKLSGKLFMDQTTPRVSLELEGREVDVGSAREAALALAGKVRTIQGIFGYVRGGRVPLIAVNARGSSFNDLGRPQNILIKGSIVDGKVFIAGTDIGLEGLNFDLEEAKGDAVISRGILQGRNLEGRWGSQRGRDGTLKRGLWGEDAPLHLEIAVETDLSQLPPLFRTMIKDETFVEEIARAYEIKGRALGRLVLDGSTKPATVRLDVSKFNLFSRYDRLPYPLEIKSGGLSYDGNTFSVKNLNGKVGKSTFSEITAELSFEKAPFLEILSGKCLILLDEIYPWLSSLEGLNLSLKDLRSMRGTLALSQLNLKGPVRKPQKWRFRTTGEVKSLRSDSSLFPASLTVTRGGFRATPEKVAFEDCETAILDASLRVSGTLNGYLKGLQKADITLLGNVGPKAMRWFSNLMQVPPKLMVRAPLSISRAHGGWDKGGKASFSADLAIKDGPRVSIDMHLNPEQLRINDALIKDRQSNASFALQLMERELHLDFDGHLDKTTLDNLLIHNEILTGRVDGDFEAHILLDQPMRSTAHGKLRGVGLGYPLELKVPLTIEDVSLEARKNRLNVESALLTWGDSHLNLNGNMEFSKEDFLFDLNLSADGLEWEKIEGVLEEDDQEGDLEGHEDFWATPLEGTLRIKLGYFNYERFTWRPLHAAISLHRGEIELAVDEANLCGISTTGTLKIYPEEVRVDFHPVARAQELDRTMSCLQTQERLYSGNFDFQGELTGRGKPEELAQALRGDFALLASDGRIYRARILSRIFGLLNTTEIFRGKFPDLGKEGFPYDAITLKGNLQKGKLILKEMIMDGSSMELVGQGEVDLITEKINLTVLVAPLKTVDFVVKKIPLVKTILGGTLVSIPVRVRGDLANPTVRPLAASAVGSELGGIMRRAFRLPIKVIQPLRRGKEGK